jgi:CRISPR system Cascade subunit CasD
MRILLLRFDALLMSFGGVMVDQNGPTDRFPGRSLLAGLFGNALGYRHQDADALTALQSGLEYAARWDVNPEPLLDYHTVDLGQPKMCSPGWTTRGYSEHRAGGTAKFGTHERYRHYWANGIMTLAVSMAQSSPVKTETLADALREPARPLFIGRKTCLPSAPLFLGIMDAPDLLAGLLYTPLAKRPCTPVQRRVEACWPAMLGPGDRSREVVVYDCRDWSNQIHAGQRLRCEGLIEVEPS